MGIAIFELIFIIILMRFIEEIGFINTCIINGVFCVIFALFSNCGLIATLTAFLYGLIYGAITFFVVKVLLLIIDVLGTIGLAVIGLLFILVIIGLIL